MVQVWLEHIMPGEHECIENVRCTVKYSYKVARRGEQVLKLAMLAGAAIIPRPLAAIGKREVSCYTEFYSNIL